MWNDKKSQNMNTTRTRRLRLELSTLLYLLILSAAALLLMSITLSKQSISEEDGYSSKYESKKGIVVQPPESTRNLRLREFPCHYTTNRDTEFHIVPNHLRRSDELSTTMNEYDISIATMMSASISTFNRLISMAERWSGHISAAVFIKDPTNIEAVSLALQKFQDDNSHILGSRVSFHLVIDNVLSRGEDVNMFPRNLLRNVAVENSKTNYVLVLDVDLAPSIGAHENLMRHLYELEEGDKRHHRNNSKYALVVPAFEKSNSQHLKKSSVSTKEEILALKKVDPGSIVPFMKKEKLSAHEATNAKKWYQSKDRYHIRFAEDYEPYVVVRKGGPPFWEHFVGFGRNKIQWIEELFLAGYNFTVVPDTFVIHKRHERYGLRKVRPYIADEYVLRFQKYLRTSYGHSMRDIVSLDKWRGLVDRKWKTQVISRGLATKYTTMRAMHAMSRKRNDEFKRCIASAV